MTWDAVVRGARILGLALLVAVTAAGVGAAGWQALAPGPAAPGVRDDPFVVLATFDVMGLVQTYGDGYFTVMTVTRGLMKIAVEADTAVIRRGAPAALADVRPGMMVGVLGSRGRAADELRASVIVCL